MVYCDPPFGNDQVWTGRAGSFDDRWKTGRDSSAGWQSLRQHSASGADLIAAICTAPGQAEYLGMMAGLLLAIRRVLRPAGTLWLHFDDTMGAHLRILGDAIFGLDLQLGTVIWKRSSGRAVKRGFARVHDTIACWGRTRVARTRLWRIGHSELTHGGYDSPLYVDGLLDDRLASTANERVGYPTQKPVSLVSRFVAAATLPGGLVLDPTCGSGTTLVAAEALGRQWIGIDQSADAIKAARARLCPKLVTQGDLFAAAA